jgi:polysaccharide export outer membrane protein
MKQQRHRAKSIVQPLMLSACVLAMSPAVSQAQSAEEMRSAAAAMSQNSNQMPSIRSTNSTSSTPSTSSTSSTPSTSSSRSIRNNRTVEREEFNPQLRPRSAPMEPEEPGVYETYVEGVTGEKLKIYGKELFRDVPTTFAPLDRGQVNQEYLIGAGDELQIRGWGMVDIDVSAKVDRSGAVYIPRVGSIMVSGIKYGDLQGYLKKAVAKQYNNFELTVSVAQTHALQVYVVGHAVRPGTYTMSSMSTLLNALFTSGGPDATGSMRNIALKRGGKTVGVFDMYDMLGKGDKNSDLNLRDGDVIYIPEVGPMVALTGNVKRPGIYELKGEATLADVMNWSGGFDSSAQTKQVVVEKNVNNQYKVIADIVATDAAVNTQLAAVPVRPTDILRVFAPESIAVEAQVVNAYVRVAGEVNQTGVIALKKNETLRELMVRLGGPNENGYLYATKLTRESVRRSQELKLREVAERFERDLESNATQRLSASTDPGNAVKVTAEVEQQRNIVKKMKEIKAEGRIALALDSSLAQVKNLPDLPLQDGDSIYVPRRPGTVEVLGSVFQQNSFVYRSNSNVDDYVKQAGGLNNNADKSEIYVLRADGTAKSGQNQGWFSGAGGIALNPGDTVVVPEKIDRSSFMQSLKDWTSIFYQFGLGAAGLKVLKD